MIATILLIIIIFHLDLNGQGVNEYNIVIPSQYNHQRSPTEEGYVDIYTVVDDDYRLRYLIYLIASSLVDAGNEIDDLYTDDNFVENIYNRLRCNPTTVPNKSIRGNTEGYETRVKFKMNGEERYIPGLLYSFLNKRRIYHILFMISNEDIHNKIEEEIDFVLNSLQL